MAESRPAPDPPFAQYPLTDFLSEASAGELARVLSVLARRQADKHWHCRDATGTNPETGERPGHVATPTDRLTRWNDDRFAHDALYQLLDGVSLCRLHGRVVRGKRGLFAYDVGLNSTKTVGFVVPNPFDTVIAFGGVRLDSAEPPKRPVLPSLESYSPGSSASRGFSMRKAGTPRVPETRRAGKKGAELPTRPELPGFRPPDDAPACDFNARMVVDRKSVLQILQIFGRDVRIYFSKGLIRPVRRNSLGKYVPTGERQVVRLGEQVITLARGHAPSLSAPLPFDDNLVQVGGQNVIATLKYVTLGGTFSEPKLVFDQTELVF